MKKSSYQIRIVIQAAKYRNYVSFVPKCKFSGNVVFQTQLWSLAHPLCTLLHSKIRMDETSLVKVLCSCTKLNLRSKFIKV